MKKISIKAREGSSLIIVICVSAFLMAFALAMIYTAGLSLSRANRRLEQERSYQLARSFSEMLEKELKRYQYLPDNKPDASEPGYNADLIAPDAGGTFYQYVVKFLEGQYGEYDPDHPDETIFHFTTGEASGGVDTENYGNIRVVMYKEADEDENEMSGTIHRDTSLDDINTKLIQRYVFTVVVTAEVNGNAFTYRTEYRQMVNYKVRFMYGTNKISVVNDGTGWKDTLGNPLEFNEGEEIQYEYLSGEANIKKCTFENTYQKEGDGTP